MHLESQYQFKYPKIEEIWYIITALSDSTFSSIEMSIGKKGKYILSCETMMSAMKTLETIDFCCSRDSYSDAYTLIRKYRDDLMQYLFILNTIQNIHGLSEDELKNFSFNDSESLFKALEQDFNILVSGERKKDEDFAMESWIYNDLAKSENSKVRKDFFDTSKYIKYLMNTDPHIKFIMENYLNQKWKEDDRKLNNYVHTNGIRYLTDNYAYQNNKETKDNELIKTLQNITDIFINLLAIIDSTKLQSSDYKDAFEMGSTPTEGCQYWVCPCIVDYINNHFDPNLLSYIQINQKYDMKLLSKYYE